MTHPEPRKHNGAREEEGAVRRPARPHARDAVAAILETDLPGLHRFWAGKGSARIPDDAAAIRTQVLEWMSDPALVESRVGSLGKRLAAVLDLHLASARYQTGLLDLINANKGKPGNAN